MIIQTIINELWNENKDKFNSEKEVRMIVIAYLRFINYSIRRTKECEIHDIGNFIVTPKGKKTIEKILQIRKKRASATKVAYTKYVVRAWRHKFIDDCFPD